MDSWSDLIIVITVIAVLLLPSSFRRRPVRLGVFDGAPIGIGTVLTTTGTGKNVRGRPQLEIRLRVDTADGRTFPATLRQAVDRSDLAAVRPDALLPVRYLSDGRVTLAVDAPAHVLQAALDRVHVAKGWLTPKQLRITEHGVEAQAVILEQTHQGPTGDGRAAVRLRLRVTRPDATTFDVVQEKKMAPASLPQLGQGMAVRVRYLAYDESEVAVLTTL